MFELTRHITLKDHEYYKDHLANIKDKDVIKFLNFEF